MGQLLASLITDRIAVGPQQGRKVFTLQTLPALVPLCPLGASRDSTSPVSTGCLRRNANTARG
jgi:hypothetical protein